MNFKQYIRQNGSIAATKCSRKHNFPKDGDWDDLTIFVNKKNIPENITTELETLHDDYFLQQEVKQ